jgi:glycosyltransferase involved in cell wall biosynthesis
LDRAVARKQLGIDAEDFLVCSFGFLSPAKLNHRLLDVWITSALGQNHRCHLIFVGENHGGDYGASLTHTIRSKGLNKCIRITGFVSPDMFRRYLMSADAAVQLRTDSRGETSRTVLDCMNYALPLVVNAHGSLAELDPDAVWMLPDVFDDTDLAAALETLRQEPERRRMLGERARRIVLKDHSPAACAQRYADAIERFHHRSKTGTRALINAIASQDRFVSEDGCLIHLAESLSATLPLMRPARRLFLDVTTTCKNDLKTGIERVARALLLALLADPPAGYRIEPVRLDVVSGKWHYFYARRYTLGLLGCPPDALDDEIVEPDCGDVLIGIDLSGDVLIQAERAGLLAAYRNHGVRVFFVVFDLLPVLMPEVFPPGADRIHMQWLQAVSACDGAVCISKAVADDFLNWRAKAVPVREDRRPFRTAWFHLGADIGRSASTRGLPDDAHRVLSQVQACPSFLMVGTIEPRKRYLQVIEAFGILWDQGVDVNLVIVGKEGWTDLPNSMRRDIPKTITCLRSHPERSRRLFWLEDTSDEYLETIYAASACLIAASEGEGFGLPLIEAARHNLPIMARNIPVFREVAGKHAFYFTAVTSGELAEAVKDWLSKRRNPSVPGSQNMPYLNWRQSAEALIHAIFDGKFS